MFQGHFSLSFSFCQSYAIKSSCIIIIAYHNVAGLILEMINFPWGKDNPQVHYLDGKRENSKAEIGMSFGLSSSLRFRTHSRFLLASHALVPSPFAPCFS